MNDADIKEGGGGMALSLIKVGWIPRPWFLLGAEISTMFHFEGNLWWSSTWVQLIHYDVVATFFPLFDRGLYTKIGVGAGIAAVQYSELTLSGTRGEQTTKYGFSLKLGLGYEWQLLSSFNLGLEVVYGLVAFGGGFGHDVVGHLVFTWY